jgi:hypothetical protein
LVVEKAAKPADEKTIPRGVGVEAGGSVLEPVLGDGYGDGG